MDIDLDDPEDVKIIEQEFQKLWDSDSQFQKNFGVEAFELEALQKYQFIDAYNKNGMQAVLSLLQTSADQSGIIQDENGEQHDDAEASMVEHNGKKYSRIAIEGLGDEEEYLMDENGDIYNLDF